MKEIFQLPDTLPIFYESDSSEKVLIEFNGEDVLYIIGTVDVSVLEGKIETWGYTMTVDTPKTALYSLGLHGLISITSANRQKAVVILEKSSQTNKWKTFMNKYVPSFNMCDINGTRLTPPKHLLELEEQLGCWFDLSKTPMSNQRLVIDEQCRGFCDELLDRPIDLGPIRVLLAGYKNSGKSTMMRYFINKCLKKWDKILVLDFDIGQSEFSIPGCISAFIIDKPLLGPNFTHLMQPLKSYFFESNDVMTNIPLYNEIVKKIVNDTKTNDLHQIPCFINTMGFVEGAGLKILHNLISKTKPSDVVQIKFNDNQDLNLHSEIINDSTRSSLSYNLWYFTSTVKNKFAKAPYLPNINKCIRQQLVTASYFSKCLESTDIYFNDIVPYRINIRNINIQIKNIDELTQDESLDIINANVIALCVANHTNLCECVGFGVVRIVNKSTGDIYITTPVTPDILKHVNQFRLGNVNLPYTFYTEGTQNPKYVCIKQDNILNENVTRHYKVM
ncbi:polynucleotide 5'-hydroxyl-kinase nol9 [Rhopalosiphum maidis]|uniref:polynucleotide 5'-hydroxyl-kinase nol9 n=1 Tax=Rhopalosiphum maidis TaxID=43146 RepID=UPI000EFF55A1|nr:polynucleotide 5'-hydroxyl-kinase nol9 [Rhopalosiphum maidis]